MEWHPCLKVLVRCVVVLEDRIKPEVFEATNSCHVDGDVCPRVAAGMKGGEGYELCGPPRHAEQEVARIVREYRNRTGNDAPGTAYIAGNDWVCRECQYALTAVGVKTFILTGRPA